MCITKSMKKYKILCASVCLLCVILLAVLTVMRFRMRQGIIGGAGMPTLILSLQLTLRSPEGIILSAAALLSLIGIVILSRK